MIRGTDKQVYHGFIERFTKSVEDYSNKIALIFNDQRLTYNELYKIVHTYVSLIRGSDNISNKVIIKPVVLYLPRGVELIASMIACQYLHVPYVPLNFNIPFARFENILTSLASGVILFDSKYANEQILKLRINNFRIIDLENCENNLNVDINFISMQDEANKSIEMDEIYRIFTSGSTGQPKAVMVSVDNCNNLVDFFSNLLNINSSSITLSTTAPGFDIFYLEYTLPLANGGQLYLLNDEQSSSVQAISEALIKITPNLYQSTPSLLKGLFQYLPIDYKFNILLVGGEALGKNLGATIWARAQFAYNVYGPTETTVWSTYQLITNSNEQRIGLPIQNTYIKIVNDQENNVNNQQGEIHIGGKGVTNGYFNNVLLTVSKFIYNADENIVWYNTNDIGFIDNEGVLNFVRREGDFVKVNGYRVDLLEIREILEEASFVVEAVVICERAHNDIDLILAFVKLKSMSSISNIELELFTHLRAHLPDYMVPSSITIVESFILNANGKLDKSALKQAKLVRKINSETVDSSQSKLLKILGRHINTENLGSEDNFFNHGLASMNAISLHMDLSVHWPQIELFHLFENSNLKSLSKFLE